MGRTLKLTWVCHVCGRDRPDSRISVAKHSHRILGSGGATATCCARFCNDDPDCFLAAQDICWMPDAEDPTCAVCGDNPVEPGLPCCDNSRCRAATLDDR